MLDFNLQLFAEDAEEITEETVDKTEQEQEVKTFTQDEVDEIIQKRLSRLEDKKEKELRERIEQEQQEAQRLAQLTADEREAELKAKQEQELLDTKAKLNRVILENDTKTLLSEENLPATAIDFVIGTDAEQTKERINTFKEMFDTAVQRGVEEQLKGTTPKIGSNTTSTALKKDDIQRFASKSRLIKD